MPLDPLITLASSIEASPGIYALLVGSGISRAAEVQTGWEVVRSLCARAAAAAGEDPGDDPMAWYVGAAGTDPDYSQLLEALAPTSADRRALLEDYFVPSDEERARGTKLPTRAHRAIARIAVAGYVKVIVTTNFDRLLEAALGEAGLDPQIIASSAAVAGMVPLHHAGVTVVKVHGDYLSPDLKNTVDELAGYEPALDELLDEIFDRYGLLVCGWSGEWDVALSDAIMRAPNRRYATYWCRRAPLAGHARDLAVHREAIEVLITDADRFFEDLADKVSALADMRASPPLTTALAVAQLKRFLPDPVARIRLHDLVTAAAHSAAEAVGEHNFPTPAGAVSREDVERRLDRYERATDRLTALLANGVYFGEPELHADLWHRAVLAVDGRKRSLAGSMALVELQGYPTLLAVFSVGLAGGASGNLGPLLDLVQTKVRTMGGTEEPLLMRSLPPWAIGNGASGLLAQAPEGRRFTPVSDHLHDVMRSVVSPFFDSDESYDDAFDALEFMLAMLNAKYGWGSYLGRFWWRYYRFPTDRIPPVAPFKAACVSAGLFDSDDEFDEFDETVRSVVEYAVQHPAF